MKMNLKPWQIGVCCAAGIAVLGGAGTGIYFGVNRAIDNKVKDQVDAAMESVYSSEAALDESETPTQAAGETTTESTAAAQPTKEPETVLVYVTPTETEKPDTPAAPETLPEPEPEPEIELVYDEKLTEDVVELLSERYPYCSYDLVTNPEFIAKSQKFWKSQLLSFSENMNHPIDHPLMCLTKQDNPTAESIIANWTTPYFSQTNFTLFYVRVYRIEGNWIFITLDVG